LSGWNKSDQDCLLPWLWSDDTDTREVTDNVNQDLYETTCEKKDNWPDGKVRKDDYWQK
jgi:hypothetical protein